MKAQRTSRPFGDRARGFTRAIAGAVIATGLMAAPALAQMHDGHGGHGGHASAGRSLGHSAAAPVGGFHNGGFNGGFRGGAYRGTASAGFGRSYAGAYRGGGRGSFGPRWGYRHYGPAFVGFGYYYDPYWAWPYIGLTAWDWPVYDEMNEAELRAQEAAFVTATSAPVSDPVTWNDGSVSGSVTPMREGHTQDGRLCREFQQQITISGKHTQAFGTACQQSDGSWQIVDQGNNTQGNNTQPY